MRIVLLGPPNSGKQEWAQKLKVPTKDRETYYISTIPPEYMLEANDITGALGAFSDYRTELYLASIRAHNQVMLDDCVYTHSPLDSYVNIVARLNMLEEGNLTTDGWVWTLMAAGTMLKDSFKYDKIFRIGKDTYDDDYDKLVDSAIDVVLEDFDVKVDSIENA